MLQGHNRGLEIFSAKICSYRSRSNGDGDLTDAESVVLDANHHKRDPHFSTEDLDQADRRALQMEWLSSHEV